MTVCTLPVPPGCSSTGKAGETQAMLKIVFVTGCALLSPPGADPEPLACATERSGFGLNTHFRGTGWVKGPGPSQPSTSSPPLSFPSLPLPSAENRTARSGRWRCFCPASPTRLPHLSFHRGRAASVLLLLLPHQRLRAAPAPLHSHVLSITSYIGHVPISVSINYLLALQELRYANVRSSLGALWESVSVCSVLRGGGGKTVVRSFVPPGPRLVRASGTRVCARWVWVVRDDAR